jgi:DNA topoisomerase-1
MDLPAHRALNDAIYTAKVMAKLQKDVEEAPQEIIEALLKFNREEAASALSDTRSVPTGCTKYDDVLDDPKLVAVRCPICGGEMIARKGAFGTFFACRKYPDCKGSMPFYRDSGILCPDCGKRILIKQTRKHKTYYCCEKYPECSFSSWDIPTGEKCPGCGSALLRKKGKNTVYCKSGCGYSDGK